MKIILLERVLFEDDAVEGQPTITGVIEGSHYIS